MDPYHYSCIKLFTFSLPIFCLLSSSWGGAASTTIPFRPPPSSALLAADTLRSRGYSIFASLIVSITTTTNFSGTLLAPPDFAFSFATAKFLNNHRPPPRPSISLLLYHTLKPPLILTWPSLSSRDDGDELRTFYNNNCLYLFRSTSYGGEVSISSSPFKNQIAAVKIRQPDLYVDEHLTIHGIDGVLDPSFATKCSVPYIVPTADAVPLQVNRVFLDRAMRALRRKGYNVVVAAMAIRRSELLSLTSVTVFAVSDENLFLKPGGFRYDFRHHVVPMRQRFADLAKSTAGGMELYTLAPNKTVIVESVDGAVNVDGVAMSMTEVYHNRWIVVVSIMSSLDDVADSQGNQPITAAVSDNSVPSPSPFSGVSTNGNSTRVPSPAPSYIEDTQGNAPTTGAVSDKSVPSPSPFSGASTNNNLRRVPSPAPAYIEEIENGIPSFEPVSIPSGSTDFDSVGTPSPAPELNLGIGDNAPRIEPAQNPVSSPTQSPAIDDVSDTHCDLNAMVSNGVEGGDLLCPVSSVRQLPETGCLSGEDVEESKPLDADSQEADDLTQSNKVKIAENVNIADDVFFYI